MTTEQMTIVYAQWDKTSDDNHWCYIKIPLKEKKYLPWKE